MGSIKLNACVSQQVKRETNCNKHVQNRKSEEWGENQTSQVFLIAIVMYHFIRVTSTMTQRRNAITKRAGEQKQPAMSDPRLLQPQADMADTAALFRLALQALLV